MNQAIVIIMNYNANTLTSNYRLGSSKLTYLYLLILSGCLFHILVRYHHNFFYYEQEVDIEKSKVKRHIYINGNLNVMVKIC